MVFKREKAHRIYYEGYSEPEVGVEAELPEPPAEFPGVQEEFPEAQAEPSKERPESSHSIKTDMKRSEDTEVLLKAVARCVPMSEVRLGIIRCLQDGSLYRNSKYSDLTIVCGDERFPVHQNIVCPRSEFFAKACDGGFPVWHC